MKSFSGLILVAVKMNEFGLIFYTATWSLIVFNVKLRL